MKRIFEWIKILASLIMLMIVAPYLLVNAAIKEIIKQKRTQKLHIYRIGFQSLSGEEQNKIIKKAQKILDRYPGGYIEDSCFDNNFHFCSTCYRYNDCEVFDFFKLKKYKEPSQLELEKMYTLNK